LHEIKRLVLAQDPTAKIYLYGSRARNSANDESDWDLLILLSRDKITREVETLIENSYWNTAISRMYKYLHTLGSGSNLGSFL
jgi:predicted nucleotidyltransferase